MTATLLPFPQRPAVERDWPRSADDARGWPKTCECTHVAHRPAEVFGRTSRFHATGSGPAHAAAAGARLRDQDAWFLVDDAVSPRVCEDCHRAGHRDGVDASPAMGELAAVVRLCTGADLSDPVFRARVAPCEGCGWTTAVATVLADDDGVTARVLCASCLIPFTPPSGTPPVGAP